MADLVTDFLYGIYRGLEQSVINIVSEAPVVIAGLLVAIAFVIIGWFVGKFFGKIVEIVLNRAALDDWAKHYGFDKAIGGLSLSHLAGIFVKWYTVLIFLSQAAMFIQLQAISTFVSTIVFYVPALLGALIIVILGLMIGRYIRNIIEATKHKYRQPAGVVAQWLVIYVTAVIGLDTMGFNVTILVEAFKIAFTALVLIVAIVLGISFGLTFRGEMKQFWLEVKKEYMK